MDKSSLSKTIRLLLLIALIGIIAHFGKPFLVPLVFAALLAMLLLPLVENLTGRGWNGGLAIVSSILLLVLFFFIIFSALTWQVSDMTKETPQLEKKITEAVGKIKNKVSSTFGLPPQRQQQTIPQSTVSSFITKILASVGGFLINSILVLVYIFLFLYYRGRLKNFAMRLVPAGQEANTRKIIGDSRKVAQKYLTGLALMISCLWVMYGIGFSIVGIKNPIFFALLCGTLEIIPFFGNLVGCSLAAAFSFVQGGGISMVVGVLIVYAIVQFVQSYILEPLVVGRGVNINPLFTIIGLVAGEFIWGLSGLVLAIPLLGITKIVCDHIEPLKPYGDLIGERKQAGNTNRFKALFTKRK